MFLTQCCISEKIPIQENSDIENRRNYKVEETEKDYYEPCWPDIHDSLYRKLFTFIKVSAIKQENQLIYCE